jgi:outer membrane immunogenic protein
MRRFAIFLMSVVALTSSGIGADAADKPVTKAKLIRKAPPPPVPSSGGTGFYVGINGGYNWGRASYSDPTGTSSARYPAGLIGATLGYNAQSGSFVYGLETDIDYAWLKGSNWTSPPCFGCEVRLRYFGTLRGRVGYAVGSALPYFTGGLAYGGVSTARPFFGTRETEDKVGWTIGGGVEYAFLGPWSAKIEYLYFELEKADCSAVACGTAVAVRMQGNLVRAGINYRF